MNTVMPFIGWNSNLYKETCSWGLYTKQFTYEISGNYIFIESIMYNSTKS